MKFKLSFMAASAGLLMVLSCKPEDDNGPVSSLTDGVFVINEGLFRTGTGTITYYNRNTSEIMDDLYSKANNGAAIGDVLQDMKIYNDTAYLVVNGKNKIILADAKTFKYIDSISGFGLPRYFYRRNNITGYVSEWGANGLTGSVKEIDLKTKTITKTILTGKGAEKLFVVGSRMYVLNNGGFGADSTMAYFTLGDTAVTKVSLRESPNSIARDINEDTWVLCSSAWDASKTGKLLKLRNNIIEKEFSVPSPSLHLTTDANGNNLYYASKGDIWKKDITNFGANPPSVFLSKTELGTTNIYGMAVDPKTGYLYCADSPSATAGCKILIIDLNTKKVVKSFTAGILANGFFFR
jgi:DNA-binding beta-propeller fold protein YncE